MIKLPSAEEVISEFVSLLRPGLQVERWPDKEVRTAEDIDAIAGDLAIEHTTIDSLPRQRLHDAQFEELVGLIRQNLNFVADRHFSVNLDYADLAEIRRVSSIAAELAAGLDDLLPSVGSRLAFKRLGNVAVGGAIYARRSSLQGVYFGRSMDTEAGSAEHLRDQLFRKVAKLGRYHGEFTTILLIESQDIALMDPSRATDYARTALSGALPSGLDQIWFADSSIGQVEFWDLTAVIEQPNSYPDRPISGAPR